MRVCNDNFSSKKAKFKKVVPNFVWHSCVHCKKVFRTKLEVIKHKREQHGTEIRLTVKNSRTESDDDDDEPAIVTVTTVANKVSNRNEAKNNGDIEEYLSPKSSTSTCSSSSLSSSSHSIIQYTVSSPPLGETEILMCNNNNPQTKSQQSVNCRSRHGTTSNNNNSRFSPSPPVTTQQVDNCSDQSNTNETSLLIVKQDKLHSNHDPPHPTVLKTNTIQLVEPRSSKQLLHQFVRKNTNNNNNSYTSPSVNKHKSPWNEAQPQEETLFQKRRRHSQDAHETLPTSSTCSSSSFSPPGTGQCSNSKRTPHPGTVKATTTTVENSQPSPNNLLMTSTNNVKGSQSLLAPSSSHQVQSNCKVLRRLSSRNPSLEPPKLKEYTQRPPTVTLTPHRTISKAFSSSSAYILPKSGCRDTQETKSFQSPNPPKTTTNKKQPPPPLSCLICRVPFLEKQDLADHLDSVHLSSAKFHCQICTEPFDRRDNYERHIMGTTCRTQYMCSFCFLHFPNLHELNFHEKTHGGPTPYSCKFCRVRYETVGSLMSHLVVHSNDEEFEYI